MSRWVSSVERVIPAPPEKLFPLVADPRRHKDIDGSGTVREATDLPEQQLGVGSTFGMNMYFGAAYTMVSTVIECEPNRRFAWQSRPAPGSTGWRHIFGGRIWRYEFEPVDGGTRVRESWDLSEERLRLFVWGYKAKTRKNMAATLERMERVATAG
jgi:uncharacterized protein YndB with AHSA1/START domain